MSEIVHLALITNIPTSTMEELNKMQKEFYLGKQKTKNITNYFM